MFKFRRVVYHEPSRLVNGEKIKRGKNKKPPPFLSEQGRLGLVADQSAATATSGNGPHQGATGGVRGGLEPGGREVTTPSAVFAVS